MVSGFGFLVSGWGVGIRERGSGLGVWDRVCEIGVEERSRSREGGALRQERGGANPKVLLFPPFVNFTGRTSIVKHFSWYKLYNPGTIFKARTTGFGGEAHARAARERGRGHRRRRRAAAPRGVRRGTPDT